MRQPGQLQRQQVGGVAGAKLTAHAFERQAGHSRIARHPQGRPGLLQRVKLQQAKSRQRPHVVGPQQMHQRVTELGQFVIELLAQAPGQKREPFEQPLHIRITPRLPQKGGQCRIALSEATAQLA